MLETAKDALVLAAAVIGLFSAWLGYRAVLKRQLATTALAIRTLRVENPTVRTRPWNMARVRWFFLTPIAVNAVVGMAFLGVERWLIWFNIVAAFLITGLIVFLRTEPPSRTVKRAEYILAATPNQVLDFSIAALTAIGANVGNYDPGVGLIKASMPMTWSSFGEVITVTVHLVDEGATRLRIESDAFQPSILTDWGANARNIRRFQEQLIQSKVPPSDHPSA